MKWQPIPISEKLFTNISEQALTKASAAIENAFINEAGGHTRFPGLVDRHTFPYSDDVYLSSWREDLVAVVAGQMYRIDQNLAATNVTGVPISGGRRVTFSGTETELVMAAGSDIVLFDGELTKLLSEDAPQSTHVAYVEGYVLAALTDTNSFEHTAANDARSWSPLDIFAANVKPDNVNALIVSPYGELLVCGKESVEQYERLQTGTTPFFRRWTAGEGLLAPYTLIAHKDGNWGVNNKYEFVRFTGQSSQSGSDDIGRSLEKVDDWSEAWATQMNLSGQKFILLQIPNATNVYGSKGITMVYDYRQKKWFSLYGWDANTGIPQRWPGWSYMPMWGRHFVGSRDGRLLELSDEAFSNMGATQRMLGRTAHLSKFGEVEITNVRMRVKRGVVGSNDAEPFINLRCLRDNNKWTRWIRRGLGKAGDRAMNIDFGPMGECHAFQFEWFVTDECSVEIVELQAQLMSIGD